MNPELLNYLMNTLGLSQNQDMGRNVGLKNYSAGEGLASGGLRHSSGFPKGSGYLGKLPTTDGRMSTEISSESDIGEYPLIVPTLTKEELGLLLSDGKPTEDIYNKAESWAKSRIGKGQSPFANRTGLLYPYPE
jgi:hypothetical protein